MVVELIHEEGQPNLRRGRYITILDVKDENDNRPSVFEDDSGMIYAMRNPPKQRSSTIGMILRVVAIEIPFVQCRVLVSQGAASAGQILQVDTRQCVLGFLSSKYVRDMLEAVNETQKLLADNGRGSCGPSSPYGASGFGGPGSPYTSG